MNVEILQQSLDIQGYAMLPSLLSPEQCTTLIEAYDEASHYRKTIEMQRYRFGSGEYKYFQYTCQ